MTVIVHHLENSRQESAMPVALGVTPSHGLDMMQFPMLAGASASCGFWRNCKSPMRSSIMHETPR